MQGWDRYLDFHMGVWCSRPEYLDRIGPKLCETGVGFHTHRGSGDIGRWSIQDSPEACCDFCAKTPGCDVWAWHTETKAYHQCHAHRSAETTPNHNPGCYSAHLPNKTALLLARVRSFTACLRRLLPLSGECGEGKHAIAVHILRVGW